MLLTLLSVGTSLLLLGGMIGLFWQTYWMEKRTPTGAFRFFRGAAGLSICGLAAGILLSYPLWFRVGASITTLVMCIQAVQTYAFGYFLRNGRDESVRLATFTGLGRRQSILEQVDGPREIQPEAAHPQKANLPERTESEI